MSTQIKTLIPLLFLLLVSLLLLASAESCESESGGPESAANKSKALKLKIGALVVILMGGLFGVSLPVLGRKNPNLNPSSNLFFIIKSFAAGVILTTGSVHILPDAFESLKSSCFGDSPPWGDYPLTGLILTLSFVATLIIDSFASAYFRSHQRSSEGVVAPAVEKEEGSHGDHVHAHSHATHGHSHVSADAQKESIRFRIVSQVLELGILVHSVIIGISLGASQSLSTIKPLVAALTFHQLFEGLGLGGCIAQANFKAGTITTMVLFFSLTTPIGIGIGIGVSETYNENSPKALIIGGVLNAAAAGILIYMAVVDLLVADFMSPKIQNSWKMQLGCSVSLLLGIAAMSILALWA